MNETQMNADKRAEPGAADRPQPNQSKDRAGVSGRRYRAGSANSKGNRKQRKKRKSRACMARAPDLRRCRCNQRLRYLRYLRFPFLASMRYPTRHDPCGKRFRRNSALRPVRRKITAGARWPSPGSNAPGAWLRGNRMNARCHRNGAKILTRRTMESHGGPHEVDLADVQNLQSALRGPPWPSPVLRVGILSCGLSNRSDRWTFTRLPWAWLDIVTHLHRVLAGPALDPHALRPTLHAAAPLRPLPDCPRF